MSDIRAAVSAVYGAYKSGKSVYKGAKGVYDKVRHSGKDKFGSFRIHDSAGRSWKVRVRVTGKRGPYLRLTAKDGSDRELKASASGYKPHEYVPITIEDWRDCALFADGRSDWSGDITNAQLYNRVRALVDRLTASG